MQTARIYLIRHGETSWTLEGKHTGLTDIPLTSNGEKQALALRDKLNQITFDKIFSSPLIRAKRTCELAGYLEKAIIDPDLVEWDYGAYEGLTTPQIHLKDPSWSIFSKGAPHAESIQAVCERADRVLNKVAGYSGKVLLFSSGHFLRILATRWIHLMPINGSHFALSPGSLSILGNERKTPAILLWNYSPQGTEY